MEYLELIKEILAKLRITFIIIGCLAIALVAKFITTDKIWLAIVFCSVYLILLLSEWTYKSINKVLSTYKEKREGEKKKEEERKKDNEIIWQHFISLNDETMSTAVAIYKSKSPDPNNTLLRLLPLSSCPSYLIYASYDCPFDIPLGDRRYLPCIWGQQKDHNALITFNDYFFQLLDHYIKTGKKEKV